MSIQKISLGKRLQLDEVFIDFNPTKKDLAAVLQTSRTTVWKWDGIAYDFLKEYREDYPKRSLSEIVNPPEKYKEPKAFDTEAALTQYQAWVISKVQSLFKQLKREVRVKAYIEARPDEFSKSRFDARQSFVNPQSTTAA
ncbi:hypothetical protein PI95_030445 [Hassallia byssoidea VB512170]|uniref:Uncharacterized protein n=1 Tax=Hassallia byssoidea VB512170 TaxID=1304833 RepID=A0A846HI33_9CYAN|nr:hypothetical protein [Hassalia byssoidea]NEU76713.1 hypothetical protein [Hassalia byssoidea VB512170]